MTLDGFQASNPSWSKHRTAATAVVILAAPLRKKTSPGWILPVSALFTCAWEANLKGKVFLVDVIPHKNIS